MYCDSLSDEILARDWLIGGPFAGAKITRLPVLSIAPPILKPILEWERLDWVVSDQESVLCAVELSRHGYTGDNSFQRFARLYRCGTLRIPVIYFTSFNRTRLNEIEQGRFSPRNVAPELFAAMNTVSRTNSTACMAVDWPTGTNGTPVPLGSRAAAPAMQELVALLTHMVTRGNPGDNSNLESEFPALIEKMTRQAALARRGSQTRGKLKLPVDILKTSWIHHFLPSGYFGSGKADKALASVALDELQSRPLITDGAAERWWENEGEARVLFLGYQWRPDPAAGLIALSAAYAQSEQSHLVVVWPRVFSQEGTEHESMMDALREFAEYGTGPILTEAHRLRFAPTKISSFRARLRSSDSQFGIYQQDSKVARIMADVASLAILGDAAIVP